MEKSSSLGRCVTMFKRVMQFLLVDSSQELACVYKNDVVPPLV